MKNLSLTSLILALWALFLLSANAFAQIDHQDEVAIVKTELEAKAEMSARRLFQKGKPHGNPFDRPIKTLKIPPMPIAEDPLKPIAKPDDLPIPEPAKRRGRSSGKWVIPDGATEYGVEVGFAPTLATWMSGPKYYDIKDRQHLLGSLRWGKILGTRAFVTYSWAIEIEPINIAFGNEVSNPKYLVGSVGEPPRKREATIGIGINPASFRFIFFPQYRLRPMLGAGFGLVRHYKRVPTVEGTKFNFQADFQIGGQYMLKENKALNFGYRYYHLSNLYLFNFNPGYNVNMFFVGYSVFK